MNNPHNINRPDLVNILEEFGSLICKNKKDYLTSIVTVTSSNGQLIDFSLYIIAPEISFEYRVINVEVVNINKLKIRFFTLITNQSQHFDIDISNTTTNFNKKLISISNSTLFQSAIQHLINQVDLKREYSNEFKKEDIILGQARVAILKDGTEIDVGWIKFENEYVYYYTGKGLRLMWKPNMDEREKEKADKLKKLPESELIRMELIEKRKITEFIGIK